jgi:transposase
MTLKMKNLMVKQKNAIKQNVGIDVSKDNIEVALSNLTVDHCVKVRSSRKFANTEQGFRQLMDWLAGKTEPDMPVHFTMEATGVYHERLAYFLYEQDFLVHVVLPNQAKKFHQSLGLKSKTDKLDARTLAQMGLERMLLLWQPISKNLLCLKQLTRERDALVRTRPSAANQLHAYRHQGKPNQKSIHRTEEHIDFMDAQIKKIEKEIAQFVNNDKELKTKMKFLLSIPGIGILTAATVVAETNGFAAFTSIKQLAGYAGLDVRTAESGKWKGKSKISKRGNSHIRKALFMPTLSKIRNNRETKRFYEHLKEKKGIGMVAAIAVERKLLGLMYSLWKKEEMYCPAC